MGLHLKMPLHKTSKLRRSAISTNFGRLDIDRDFFLGRLDQMLLFYIIDLIDPYKFVTCGKDLTICFSEMKSEFWGYGLISQYFTMSGLPHLRTQ